MIARWKNVFTIAVALLLLGGVPARAQSGSAVEDLAWSLYRAYEAGDEYHFQSLFSQDPVLTKRAYVYTLTFAYQAEEEGREEEAMAAVELALVLAQAIHQSFGDPQPLQILSLVQEGEDEQAARAALQYDQALAGTAVAAQPAYPAPNQAPDEPAQPAHNPPPAQSPQNAPEPPVALAEIQASIGPRGESHAESLRQAYEADDKSRFRTLLLEDPSLSKRAYLATFLKLLNQAQTDQDAASESTAAFLYLLGQTIETNLNDPGPMQITQALIVQDPDTLQKVWAYASTLGPEGVAQAPAAQVSPQLEDAMTRLAIKLLRATLAVGLSDPALILQELDTFGPVLTVVQKSLTNEAGAWPPEAEAEFEKIRQALALFRLQVMAEIGLLQEFDSQALQILKDDTFVDMRMGLFITGYRMALRQEQYDVARSFLDRAKQEMAKSTEANTPVHKFIIKSAEHQMRLVGGASPSDQQTLTSFHDAWSELSAYNAGAQPDQDVVWAYGRHFARFWIEALASIESPEGRQALEDILNQTTAWMNSVTAHQGEQTDDVFTKLEGQLTLTFSCIDILLHVLEEKPILMANVELPKLQALNSTFEPLAELGSFLSPGGDGFPPFDLTDSTLVEETRIRIQFLEGLHPALPASQRVAALEAALPQMEGLDRPDLYIDYHLKVGSALKNADRGDLAVTAWEKAYQKAQELNFVSRSVDAAALLAKEYGARNQWEKSLFYASKANQGLQQELGTSEATTGIAMVQKNADLTQLGATAAIKANDPQKALAILTEGQQMNTAAVQLSGNKEAAVATKELQNTKQQVASLSQKVQELQQLPQSSTRDEMLTKAESLLAQTRSEFLLQSRNIRQKFSKLYTTALRFDPLNLPDVQKALPAGTAVVQYFATDEELYIFVVTRDQFRLRSVAEQKESLDEKVLAYLRRVQRTSANDPQLAQLSTDLYQTLVAPVEEDLAGSETVVLIPSGKLNVLPFAALTDPSGKLFLEKKTLLELAKPTDFMKIAQTPAKQVSSVVAFANATKDLPAAEKEGERIAQIFPGSKLFTRDEATKAALMKFGSQAEVLHLATHGTWDASNSLNNHLKLSNNEKLAQEEIFNLNLEDTSIVTLSACSTALADTKDVEYVASLAEAFWIAGSSSVVASLWPVDDESTGVLMTKFYERLKAGEGRAKALQQAQLAVRDDPRFSHPYFWSGFLLFGDYR